MHLLESIIKAINASGETPYAIARGAGVNKSALSRLLNGERGLSIESVERIAEYLGLEIVLRPKGGKRKGR